MGVKKVFIFGGTHGNEWTGIYAIKKFASLISSEFKELDIEFILANPEAFKINKRFKDEDLNRAFQYLNENRSHSYEHSRAREIQKLIKKQECFVIDLHTTTSNMGSTIIITRNHKSNFTVCSGLSNVKIIFSPDVEKKYLVSQSETGVMIEVGPVANGLIEAVPLYETLRLIREILFNLIVKKPTPSILEVYEEVEDIYYPQKDGEIDGHIHEQFQGKDFQGLYGEYIPFRNFSGQEIRKETKEVLYPIFINEAAYYSSKLAFTLCRKKNFNTNAMPNIN